MALRGHLILSKVCGISPVLPISKDERQWKYLLKFPLLKLLLVRVLWSQVTENLVKLFLSQETGSPNGKLWGRYRVRRSSQQMLRWCWCQISISPLCFPLCSLHSQMGCFYILAETFNGSSRFTLHRRSNSKRKRVSFFSNLVVGTHYFICVVCLTLI